MMSCIYRSKPPDSFFHGPKRACDHYTTPCQENSPSNLMRYVLLAPVLRDKANVLLRQPKTVVTIEAVSALVQECKASDMMLLSWPSTIPEGWNYFTFAKLTG